MRTVCGLARRMQRFVRRGVRPIVVGSPRSVADQQIVARRPAPGGRLGEQRRDGVLLTQVDSTTCGSAVLVMLAALFETAADRAGSDRSPGARFGARQLQVHRQTNRFWPRALGTTPWGMVRWLHDHAPAAGSYRVRLVDDLAAADVDEVIAMVVAALVAGRPVPLLVGAAVPRHYVLALGPHADGWRVYEPTSGSVRALDPAAIRRRSLALVLGHERLHAVLLPA